VPFYYGLRQEQIMLEDSVLERGELALHGLETPESVAAFGRERDLQSRTQEAPSRNSPLRETPVAKEPASPVESEQGRPRQTKRPQNSFLRRRPIISAIGAVLLAAVLGGGYLYIDDISRFQSTDDAFIAARQSALAPKVSGYITAVPVTDNQHVATGAVIARIDDRDYRIALDQAEAQVAAAQASIENIDAQLGVQAAQVNANQAQVDQAQATLVFAQQQAERYQHLEKTGYGTVQNSEQYTSQLHQQQAALQSAQATLNLAQRQLGALKAQRKSAVASLAQAQAQRDQAQLNLSYTTVTAAQPGRVVDLGAAVGQFAQPGTNLTMFVPDEIWVTANFKEIQLDRMRPGEPVTLAIDAYPDA
jgi:membrane fusion protein, multidrug efflux system